MRRFVLLVSCFFIFVSSTYAQYNDKSASYVSLTEAFKKQNKGLNVDSDFINYFPENLKNRLIPVDKDNKKFASGVKFMAFSYNHKLKSGKNIFITAWFLGKKKSIFKITIKGSPDKSKLSMVTGLAIYRPGDCSTLEVSKKDKQMICQKPVKVVTNFFKFSKSEKNKLGKAVQDCLQYIREKYENLEELSIEDNF